MLIGEKFVDFCGFPLLSASNFKHSLQAQTTLTEKKNSYYKQCECERMNIKIKYLFTKPNRNKMLKYPLVHCSQRKVSDYIEMSIIKMRCAVRRGHFR